MGLVITVALANIIVVPIVLFFAPQIVKMSAIPPNILAPIVIAVVTMAGFMGTQRPADLVAKAVFGILGVFMKAYGWPRPPILIAVVLTPVVERFMWLATQSYGFSMFLRPQLVIMVMLIIIVIVASLRMQGKARKVAQPGAEAPVQGGQS